MKVLLVGLAGCLAFCVSGSAAAADAQLMAPVHQFIDNFNKGDVKAAAASHAASVTIIDEVAPYIWQGSGAFMAWATSLQNDAKAKGLTDPKVTVSDATREEVAGDHAYIVVPAVYEFKDKSGPMREQGQMTYTLQKAGAGWKITGWTWTGPKASPAN